MFVALCAGALCALSREAADRIARLDGLINPFIKDWRHAVGDVPGAERPEFDDSEWTVCGPGSTWETDHVAWFRGTISVPEKVLNLPTKGSVVRLRAGVHQDGIIFVNGQVRQHFWRDLCSIVLTEDSQPGETFYVAIKGHRHGSTGEFLWSLLEIGAVEQSLPDVQEYILDFRFGEKALSRADDATRGRLERALVRSAEILDIEALEAMDINAFRNSLAPAREALAPVAAYVKEFTCHLVGHAHIDMNWLWLWPETVEVCQNTFTAMTDLMSDFPEFTFSQSQPTTYIAVQETKPDLFAKMKRYIKQGRFEIIGGTWVEGDMNIASGESIVRQMLYAKRYFRETFGKDVEVCWEPDTFGHAWTVPQIMKKSGLKYYYFHRCGKGEPLFWWEGPDGSRVLGFNDYGYSDVMKHQAGEEALDLHRRYGVKDALIVYGVGDHGGGPTRHDVETAVRLQKRQILPQWKFSTFHDYMSKIESLAPKLPVIRDELNFEFDGCYTTHADIKQWNRACENNLPAAEVFSVIAQRVGCMYPSGAFREAWQSTCFNQFHDILDGSGIHGTYDYSREVFGKVEATYNSSLSTSLAAIAGDVSTSACEGTPVVVFNPLSWERDEIVELDAPKALRGSLVAKDKDGVPVPVQKVGGKLTFLATGVPSMGYKTFWLVKGRAAKAPPTVKAEGTTLENEFLKVKVHPKKGVVTSIYDKANGREVVPKGSFADQLQILMEKPHGMSAWNIGEVRSSRDLKTARSVETVSAGPNVGVIRTTHAFRKSEFTQDIRLNAGSRQVEMRLTADWYEQGTPKNDAAMLKVAFPVNVPAEKTTYELPFGFIQRNNTGAEYPSLKWIDLSDGRYGVSLLNSNKYGHDVSGNRMRLTLLRSSYDPDPQPDQGRHEMTYILYPHAGDWKQAETVRRAWELNSPLMALMVDRHEGGLPAERSFVSVDAGNIVVTALKKAEDSQDIVLRFFDAFGVDVKASIRVDLPAKTWQESDLLENGLSDTGGNIKSGVISVPVTKHEIKTLLLR